MEHHALAKNIDDAVKVAVDRLELKTDGILTYGWHQKSAGCRVITSDGQELWLRLQSRAIDSEPSKLWFGLQEADPIPVKNKPRLKTIIEWESGDRLWRAELMTFVPFSICSPTAEIRTPLTLRTSWYETLRQSLDTLSSFKTERVNARQDLITRRLQEKFGSQVDPTVDVWTTAHGDIHWANLTAPECWIFDWEAWGRAPLGLDAATLYCFSLLQYEIANNVYMAFKDLLDTPDGIRSQLFMCAELMRMTELYGDHPDLHPHLEKLSNGLITHAPR